MCLSLTDDHNYIHPLSSDPSRLHTETNTDIPGVFVYRIDDNEIVEPSQGIIIIFLLCF